MRKLAVFTMIAALLTFASCTGKVLYPSEDSSAESSAEFSAEPSVEPSKEASEEPSAEPSEEFSVPQVIDRTLTKKLISENCIYQANGAKHYMYADDGKQLTNGILGAEVGWGYETRDAIFILDFGEVKNGLADFDALLRDGMWGITGPDTAEYYVSNDGKKWELVGTVTGDGRIDAPADSQWVQHSFPLQLENSVSGRYVKFRLYGEKMNFAWMHEIAVYTYEEETSFEKHDFKGTESFTNLTMQNANDKDMGDRYAPGYCVYSKKGYNKSELVFEMPQAVVQPFGKDGGRVVTYVFLGINVYDKNGYWQNCCDAGFQYSNETNGWHLFWATATDENGQRGWFNTSKTLNPKHTYKLILDNSEKDGYAKVTAFDLDTNQAADSYEFKLWGSKKDGINTDHLTDVAIDWAGEETTGKDWVEERDWVEITNKYKNSGMCLKNVRLYGIALYKNGERFDWTKDLTRFRGIWSDKTHPIDFVTTSIHHCTEDYEYIIDLTLEG